MCYHGLSCGPSWGSGLESKAASPLRFDNDECEIVHSSHCEPSWCSCRLGPWYEFPSIATHLSRSET